MCERNFLRNFGTEVVRDLPGQGGERKVTQDSCLLEKGLEHHSGKGACREVLHTTIPSMGQISQRLVFFKEESKYQILHSCISVFKY